jgi:HEPN domain-containing protein
MTEEQPSFDVEEVIHYWLVEAEEALQVAEHLVEKADYSYALFFGHLAVEKMLKALHASRIRQHAPPVHNLLRLARLAGVEPDETQIEALLAITAFNIEARYPDLKRTFRQRCTSEFAAREMARVKEVFGWLRSLLLSETV